MKKKILLGIGIGFVVVVAAVAIILSFFLGNVIKAGMETVGPKVTQTALTVDSVRVRPLAGYVSLNNFVLGNPEEYKAKAPNAITVGKTVVSVATLSVLSDKIVVKDIEVHDAEIFFEGKLPLFTENNLKKIQDNVNAFVGAPAKPAGTNAPAKPAGEKPAKKLEVDNFLIAGAKVHFNGVLIPLPDIHLTNLGTGPDGITPAELLRDVLGEITTATLKAVTSSVGEAGKAVGNEASKAVKSIGNLFKK
jgi:uncharacterized protein involved in outer membrane biogenesis